MAKRESFCTHKFRNSSSFHVITGLENQPVSQENGCLFSNLLSGFEQGPYCLDTFLQDWLYIIISPGK